MKIKKIIAIGLMLSILLSINACAYASPEPDIVAPEPDIVGTARSWIRLGKESDSLPKRADWTSMNGLVDMLWGAGIFAVLIAGTILGIKYMLASVEEKANIKESMKPYIIGSIIILGALSIWKLCISVLQTM